MDKHFMMPILVVLTACSTNSDTAAILATRLANEGGAEHSQEYRDAYVACGVKALSTVSNSKLNAALKAPDVPAIWEILGSDTLDTYVKACRQADLQRGRRKP